MSKHTPGPWTLDYDEDGCTVDAAGELIAVTNDREYFSTGLRREICQANARLISTAPELLEAAKLALANAESYIHDQYDGTSFLYDRLSELEPVRAAIAKAEGKDGR